MAGRVGLAIVAVVLLVLLVASLYAGFFQLGIVPAGPVSGDLKISGPKTGTPIAPGFWGINVRSIDSSPSNTAQLLGATPMNYWRYPGGIVGERMDYSTDTIYGYGGGTSTPGFALPDFISACLSSGCHAILQLPLEINSPSTGAKEVQFVENNLGFKPAYWELGNEPGGWSCFGVPWANWGSACIGGTDPGTFAQVTKNYISAVRGVDPTAQFIGLGGTGQGSGNNVQWITPLEQVDGPNLAAISIHSYVDGSGPPAATLSGFFSGLASTHDLPNILSEARGAITSACHTCSTQVFVTEMGSANGGGSYGQYLGTYYDALFLAAEITEGLNSRAANLDPFAWNVGSGGFLNGQTPGPKYVLASVVFSKLGTTQLNSTVGGASGVYTVATFTSSATQVLAVNTNTASTANIALAGSGLPSTNSATLWTWTSSQGSPVSSTVSTNTTLSLPPTSLGLVVANGAPNCNCNVTYTSPSSGPSFAGIPLEWIEGGVLIVAGGLAVWLLPGRWKLVAIPLFAGAIVLFVFSVAVTGS